MRLGEWINRSDTELVIAALLGNLEAFGELVGRFRPAVSILVSGIVNSREAAEDVVQDVFLLAFKSLPLLRDEESFASWLYAIARNRAIRYLQREKRIVHLSELDMFILRESKAFDIEAGENPESIVEQDESCEEVREALGRLPEHYRVALHLRYWGDMPLQGMADFLGVPLSVVKWRLHKGKQLLKDQLNGKWEEENQWSRKKNSEE